MAQTNNIELINCTYRLKEFVWKIVDEYQDAMYDEEHGEGTAEAAVAGTSDAVVSKAGGNGKRPETSNAAVVVEILGNSVKV